MCGPQSAWVSVARPRTLAFGPGTSEPKAKSCRPSSESQSRIADQVVLALVHVKRVTAVALDLADRIDALALGHGDGTGVVGEFDHGKAEEPPGHTPNPGVG